MVTAAVAVEAVADLGIEPGSSLPALVDAPEVMPAADRPLSRPTVGTCGGRLDPTTPLPELGDLSDGSASG